MSGLSSADLIQQIVGAYSGVNQAADNVAMQAIGGHWVLHQAQDALDAIVLLSTVLREPEELEAGLAVSARQCPDEFGVVDDDVLERQDDLASGLDPGQGIQESDELGEASTRTGQAVLQWPALPGTVVKGERPRPRVPMQPGPHHIVAHPEDLRDLLDGVAARAQQHHSAPCDTRPTARRRACSNARRCSSDIARSLSPCHASAQNGPHSTSQNRAALLFRCFGGVPGMPWNCGNLPATAA